VERRLLDLLDVAAHPFEHGHDGLLLVLADAREQQLEPVGHHVTNVMVEEGDGDTASVRSKGLSVMADGTAGTVTYDDVVVRTGVGWRIARRTIVPARTA
jgi:hypothetical protein